MDRRVCAGIGVFIWKDGKFLMGQRAGDHGAGTWSVPGGWLEAGESWEQAAIREVKEETGLRIQNIRFVTATNNVFGSEQKHTVTIWLDSEWASGEPRILEPDKFIKQGWYTFPSLPSPLFEPCWRQLRVMRPDLFTGQQV